VFIGHASEVTPFLEDLDLVRECPSGILVEQRFEWRLIDKVHQQEHPELDATYLG
jgi:hypothetical protein